MKQFRYISSALILLMACACVKEPSFGVRPESGPDIRFGLSLEKRLSTRTVYGDEADGAFPVYWVDGDKVLIASPQCVDGRNSAEFEVACSTATQNYADALTRTGEYGLQWGEGYTYGTSEGLHDFYSIYPSVGSTLEVNNGEVVANLSVASTQHAHTTQSTKFSGFYSQPKDMGNVMMYAFAEGVAKNVDAVNLRYIPFSTVLEFTINAPTAVSAEEIAKITVQSLSLTAPEGVYIAGNFQFNFPNQNTDNKPSVESVTTGSNKITVHLVEDNVYKTILTPDQPTLKVKMCIMPIAGVTTMDGWTITLSTDVGVFQETISGTEGNTALTPGKVHKMILPTLSYKDSTWEYNTGDWITALPDYRNIYLTEISLPGAWYAGLPVNERVGTSIKNFGYQSTSSFGDMWDDGVRAFGVECRSYSTRRYSLSSRNAPSRVCVSGLGSDNNGAYTDQLVNGRTIYIADVISQLADLVSDTDEFAVLVLNYAYGGSGGYDDVDYEFFLNGIKNEISESKKSNVISSISPSTTVASVQGNLIIKINIDSRVSYDASGVNALMSTVPLAKDLPNDKVYFSPITLGTWTKGRNDYEETILNDGMTLWWCFNNANRTRVDDSADTGIPTYTQRRAVLEIMMEHSKQIYNNSTHNVWFYFNSGGTQTTGLNDNTDDSNGTNAINFAAQMNPWLLGKINAKLNTNDASPLGIVMFNQCTNDSYSGPAIIKAIIEMNSKFYLKHQGDDYLGSTTQVIPKSNGAYAPVGGNAF